MASAVLGSCAATLRQRLHPGSVEFWMPLAPAAAYWLVAVVFDVLDQLQLPATERRRIHSKRNADARNAPLTRGVLIRGVLLQHALQVVASAALTLVDPGFCDRARVAAAAGAPALVWARFAASWVAAMLVMDAWQYAIHRAMHESKALYNRVHSQHHQLRVCYAYGALYNHPAEGLLLDTVGAMITMAASGLSCEASVVFFTFASVKTVLDHSGYVWPVNPLHGLLPNNAAYHDVHHHPRGLRTNYCQPFFVHWDWLLGTYTHPAAFERLLAGGGRKGGGAGGGEAVAAGAGGGGEGDAGERKKEM